VTIPFSTVYNSLVVDPHGYPNYRRSREVMDDFRQDDLDFTLHQGHVHDGSALTSADIKASWDKIISPPEGVVSPRRSLYQMVKSIETSDPHTVVFRLHYASPSFLSMLAHPANFVYAKKYLDQDPNYYKQHAMGSGPFKLKEYVRGASIEMERNPKYWKQGLPYMDSIKYYIIKDDGARAKSIRADRTDVEFRGFAPAEVEGITNQMGNKVIVAYPTTGRTGHYFNVDKKP
jgi:peptide/nickel transport system substrate-binding protein